MSLLPSLLLVRVFAATSTMWPQIVGNVHAQPVFDSCAHTARAVGKKVQALRNFCRVDGSSEYG